MQGLLKEAEAEAEAAEAVPGKKAAEQEVQRLSVAAKELEMTQALLEERERALAKAAVLAAYNDNPNRQLDILQFIKIHSRVPHANPPGSVKGQEAIVEGWSLLVCGQQTPCALAQNALTTSQSHELAHSPPSYLRQQTGSSSTQPQAPSRKQQAASSSEAAKQRTSEPANQRSSEAAASTALKPAS